MIGYTPRERQWCGCPFEIVDGGGVNGGGSCFGGERGFDLLEGLLVLGEVGGYCGCDVFGWYDFRKSWKRLMGEQWI